MHDAERRLARHDDERASLLEHHVGGPREKRVRDPVRDPRGRSHRARHDHHGVPPGASARERRLVVAHAPDGHAERLAQVAAALERPHLRRGLRDAYADLHVLSRAQEGDESARVGSAAGPGDSDDDLLHSAMPPLLQPHTIDATPRVRSSPRTFAKPTCSSVRSYSSRVRKPAMLRARYRYASASPETMPPTAGSTTSRVRAVERARREPGRRERARASRRRRRAAARGAPRGRRARGRPGCGCRSRRRPPRTPRPRTAAPSRRRRRSPRPAPCAVPPRASPERSRRRRSRSRGRSRAEHRREVHRPRAEIEHGAGRRTARPRRPRERASADRCPPTRCD